MRTEKEIRSMVDRLHKILDRWANGEIPAMTKKEMAYLANASEALAWVLEEINTTDWIGEAYLTLERYE